MFYRPMDYRKVNMFQVRDATGTSTGKWELLPGFEVNCVSQIIEWYRLRNPEMTSERFRLQEVPEHIPFRYVVQFDLKNVGIIYDQKPKTI